MCSPSASLSCKCLASLHPSICLTLRFCVVSPLSASSSSLDPLIYFGAPNPLAQRSPFLPSHGRRTKTRHSVAEPTFPLIPDLVDGNPWRFPFSPRLFVGLQKFFPRSALQPLLVRNEKGELSNFIPLIPFTKLPGTWSNCW